MKYRRLFAFTGQLAGRWIGEPSQISLPQSCKEIAVLGPLYCPKCKRANSPTAKMCIWCGGAVGSGAAIARIERTHLEVDYLSGIDGLGDPGPVTLEIDNQGLSVTAGRTVRVNASAIVEATVVDASYTLKGKRGRASWKWWLVIGPFALLIPGKKKPDEIKHDYLLTVQYKSSGRVKSAVFHREDRLGLSLMEGLARIITSLAARQSSIREY